jgi:two-component sensor histidine kinase
MRFLLTGITFFLLINVSIADTLLEKYKNIIAKEVSLDQKKESLFNFIQEISWNEPDSTISICEHLEKIESLHLNDNDLSQIQYYKGRAQRAKGNYQNALKKFRESLMFANKSGDNINIAKACYQIGILNLFIGNMGVSIEHLLKAKNIYDQYGSLTDQADMLNALASYYSENKKLEKAIDAYRDALNRYKQEGDTLGQANVHANLGMLLIDEEKFEEAEYHILMQGKLDTLLKTEWGLGFHYDFMGYLYEKQKLFEKALSWYKKSLATRKNQNSHYNICESNISLGKLLIKMGDCQSAIKYLEEIFKYKEEHQSLSQEQSAHLYLSKCYEKTGHLKLSLSHYKSYKTISDSIYQKDKLKEIAEMEVLLEQSELDKKIVLLNKDNEIKAFELSKQHMIILSSLFGLLAFTIFSIWIYKLYLKIKLRNIKISSALNDKDILLREIHHRVKNNLQVISSLLSLQSRQIKDTNIKQAIDEGRNRVRSMALIHQNLYQRESLTGINVNTYLQKLIEELFETYNISQETIKLELDITYLELDVDTMIPMGLIINELVSNSLKHAFSENKSGLIRISLAEINNNLLLSVSDNGKGINPEEMYKSKTFGNRLLRAFGQKLKAELIIKSDKGTQISLAIKKYKKAS